MRVGRPWHREAVAAQPLAVPKAGAGLEPPGTVEGGTGRALSSFPIQAMLELSDFEHSPQPGRAAPHGEGSEAAPGETGPMAVLLFHMQKSIRR